MFQDGTTDFHERHEVCVCVVGRIVGTDGFSGFFGGKVGR
jgi:hypothetical protein